MYSKLVAATFEIIVAGGLFGCYTETHSILKQLAFLAGSALFLLTGTRLAFFGRVRVDREARIVYVPRRLWGRRAIPFDEIVGVGTTDTALLIGRWADGARVVCLTLDREDVKNFICIKCYSLCTLQFSRTVFRRATALRGTIGEPDHVQWGDWFAGIPVIENPDELKR